MPSGVISTWFQANAAVITASTSRMPVLLTAPFRVIAPSVRETTAPLPRSRKVDSFRAGLPLRMSVLNGCVELDMRIQGKRFQGRPAGDAGTRRPGGRPGMVRKGGLEPPRLAALVPKTRASTNSATFAMARAGARRTKKAPGGPGASSVVGRQGFEPWTY